MVEMLKDVKVMYSVFGSLETMDLDKVSDWSFVDDMVIYYDSDSRIMLEIPRSIYMGTKVYNNYPADD
jgi:hypothetical protein